jgi:hypothetical protein
VKRVLTLSAALLLALPACSERPGSQVGLDAATSTKQVAASRPSAKGIATASVGTRTARIELLVDPAAVTSEETPRAILVNTGEVRVGYSDPFALERRTGSGWRHVNRWQAFRIPLLILVPGARSDPQPISLYLTGPVRVRLRPGLYRLTKAIDVAPGQPRPPYMHVRTTFRVLRGPRPGGPRTQSHGGDGLYRSASDS